VKAAVRLNWGSPESPEITAGDLISAATAPVPLIRPEEFRKNAIKILGWELWDDPNASKAPVGSDVRSNGNGSGGGM